MLEAAKVVQVSLISFTQFLSIAPSYIAVTSYLNQETDIRVSLVSSLQNYSVHTMFSNCTHVVFMYIWV